MPSNSSRARPAILAFAGLCAALLLAGSPALAQDRALIIGIGAFADQKLGTPAPVDGDIATMQKLLLGRLGFAKDEIKVLRGNGATKATILSGITEWLRPDKKELDERREDQEKIRSGKLKRQQVRALQRKWRSAARGPKRSYIYYAGPGFFRRDLDGEEADRFDETIIPYDAAIVGRGTNSAISGAITDDEFSDAIHTLEGRDVTVVLDTSHSGLVTRTGRSREGPPDTTRLPELAGVVRDLEPDTPVAVQKGEGGFVETSFDEGSLAVWSAVAPSQTELIDAGGEKPGGLFTRFYVEGLTGDAADANGNGYISNAELLVHVADKMAAWCGEHAARCEMGLTPRLEPYRAFGRRAAPGKTREWKLSLRRFQDYLVRGQGEDIVLTQDPPSPVKVGDTRLRFTVKAPHEGTLILLSLTDGGQLIQLYPNLWSKQAGRSGTGRIAANAPIAIPDAEYGMQLTATDPDKGNVIAIFTRDPVDFGKNVNERSIGDIPRSEALSEYLPRLSAALAGPVYARSAAHNSSLADWSVVTLPFEIREREKPKPGKDKAAAAKPDKKQ